MNDEGLIRALFPLGGIVATPGAISLAKEKGVGLGVYIKRHATGDFGTIGNYKDRHDIPEGDARYDDKWHDLAKNVDALQPTSPARLMSAYVIDDEKLWIITEWDRSITTLLLPSEY